MVKRLAGFLFCAGAALSWTTQDQAPPPDRMLLWALQGHRYERVSYDAKGRVEERATIDVGRLEVDGDQVSVSMEGEVYKNDAPGRRFSTRWTCTRRGGDMVMAILVFAGDLDKPSMRLETTGAPLIYPAGVPDSGMLPDVSVDVKVRQGVLRIFGARTRITLAERRIAAAPAAPQPALPAGVYSITSRAELRAYAWGIRVRRIRFESEELVDPTEGVLQHVLTREDGSYSALRRLR